MQSEYFQVLMNSGEQYQGGYAFLSYFLTGESRGYRKENKTIDRAIPLRAVLLGRHVPRAGAAAGVRGKSRSAIRGSTSTTATTSWSTAPATSSDESAARLQQRRHHRRELVPESVVACVLRLRT